MQWYVYLLTVAATGAFGWFALEFLGRPIRNLQNVDKICEALLRRLRARAFGPPGVDPRGPAGHHVLAATRGSFQLALYWRSISAVAR